jgi:hypothetical protein
LGKISEESGGGGGFLLADRFYSRRRERSEWRARTLVTGHWCQAGAAAPPKHGWSPVLSQCAPRVVSV